MIDTEREKLYSRTKKYLSIGITEKGEPVNTIAIPWSQPGSVFNMRTPDVFLCEEDLYNEEIRRRLFSFNIVGFYAFCALHNYDVIGFFSELQDIFIKNAYDMENISFADNMNRLSMIFIHGATLPNLNPLIHSKEEKRDRSPYRIGLYDCRVADISMLTDSDMDIYELSIWNKWSKAEDARWRALKPLVYNFYKLDK